MCLSLFSTIYDRRELECPIVPELLSITIMKRHPTDWLPLAGSLYHCHGYTISAMSKVFSNTSCNLHAPPSRWFTLKFRALWMFKPPVLPRLSSAKHTLVLSLSDKLVESTIFKGLLPRRHWWELYHKSLPNRRLFGRGLCYSSHQCMYRHPTLVRLKRKLPTLAS